MKRLLLLMPVLIAGGALANEQLIIDRIEAMRAGEVEQEARKKEASLSAHKKRWRKFPCPGSSLSLQIKSRSFCESMEYDWYSWTRNGTIYTTTRQSPLLQISGFRFGGSIPEKVSVDCRTLKIRLPEKRMISEVAEIQQTDPDILKRYRELNSHAQHWRLPIEGSETAMVAARCSSAK